MMQAVVQEKRCQSRKLGVTSLSLMMYLKMLSRKKWLIDSAPSSGSMAALDARPVIHGYIEKMFHGSLAIRVVTAGSTNACEQELVALGNPYYDVERFGVHFVASPRHADMLMVTGPVSRNMREALLRTYSAMPEPKVVVAVGDDAIDGGIFKGCYAVMDGAYQVIPVYYQIPGDPPSPRTILCSLRQILSDLDVQLRG
jgi:Ni,Fe-hydrogenase III small subunit